LRPAGLRLVLVIVAAQLAVAEPAGSQQLSPSGAPFWMISGAAFAAAWSADPELRRSPPAERVGTAGRLAWLGDEIAVRRNVLPALFGVIVLSELAEWPAPSERFVRLSAGAFTSQVATSAVMLVAGRGRPREVGEPRRFRPFTREGEWQALPSGHASSAFSLAAGSGAEFDLPLPAELLAYALAMLSAWSRVYDDAHWASDVVAGAVVGIAGARTTVRWLQRRAEGNEDEMAGAVAPAVPIVLLRIPLP
jgi:membrane-associated phospholipid phosphatase